MLLSRLLTTCVAAVLTLVGMKIPCTLAAENPSVGFVLEVSGKWHLAGDKQPIELTGGMLLPPTGKLQPEIKGDQIYVTVSLSNGETHRYEDAVTLPGLSKVSFAQRFYAALAGKFRGGVVQAASRGSEMIEDAVLECKEGVVDLAPAVAELPDGEWKIQFVKPTAKPTESAPGAAPLKLHWQAGEGAEVATKIAPGFYLMQLLNPRTNRVIGESAAVLLCTSHDFPSKRHSYAEAVAMTETWEEAIQDSVGTTFLRAYLQTLAEETPAEGTTPSAPAKSSGSENAPGDS